MFNKRLFAVLLGAAVVCMFAGDVVAQWETVWELGAPGRGWPQDQGGVIYVQEAGVNDPPGDPMSPAVNQQADDDYYVAGTYPDPIGTVPDELVSERAFAGIDNNLRFHFNLDTLDPPLHPDDMFRVSFEANNLHEDPELNSDPRYGIEVYVNGTLVHPEQIIRPAELNTVFTTAEFTAGDVGLSGAAGADNIVLLTGNTNNGANYNAEGGGNWMGLDYQHLERMPVPEPGSLSMLLCGIFWMIPLVCWEKKSGAK